MCAGIGDLRFVRRHIAGRRALLMGARLGGVQIGLRGIHIFLRAIHRRLLRLQLFVGADPVLVGRYALIGQLHHALGVALDARQVGLGLRQRRLCRRQPRLCIHHAAVGLAQRLRFGSLQRRHLHVVRIDGRARRVLLGFQLGGINFGDQVAGFNLEPSSTLSFSTRPAILELTITWLASTMPMSTVSLLRSVE